MATLGRPPRTVRLPSWAGCPDRAQWRSASSLTKLAAFVCCFAFARLPRAGSFNVLNIQCKNVTLSQPKNLSYLLPMPGNFLELKAG